MAKEDNKAKTTKVEIEREKLLSASEISLWLDGYNDIFSDFDPREYDQRALSVDFLDEMRRASRDKVSGQIELKLLIHSRCRSAEKEKHIKKRLVEHFKKHYSNLVNEKKRFFVTGIILTIIGFALMIFAVHLRYSQNNNISTLTLITLFEPSGWFALWYGLDKIFYFPKTIQAEIDFYKKMVSADISFTSY